jgi:hypothetical protein
MGLFGPSIPETSTTIQACEGSAGWSWWPLLTRGGRFLNYGASPGHGLAVRSDLHMGSRRLPRQAWQPQRPWLAWFAAQKKQCQVQDRMGCKERQWWPVARPLRGRVLRAGAAPGRSSCCRSPCRASSGRAGRWDKAGAFCVEWP